MLKIVEPTLKKEGKTVMLVDSSSSKKSSKNMKRKITKQKGGAAKKKAKETSSKGTCFHCGKEGNWERNCKAYMESKKKMPLQEKMQFLTYIILTYDNICQYCVFKLSIMTYITYFKAIMTFVHDLG